MSALLVDTDILVDLFRRSEAAGDYLDSLGDWSVSVVSGMELLAGAKDKSEAHEIDIMLATYRTVPLSEDIGRLGYNLMKAPFPVRRRSTANLLGDLAARSKK